MRSGLGNEYKNKREQEKDEVVCQEDRGLGAQADKEVRCHRAREKGYCEPWQLGGKYCDKIDPGTVYQRRLHERRVDRGVYARMPRLGKLKTHSFAVKNGANSHGDREAEIKMNESLQRKRKQSS